MEKLSLIGKINILVGIIFFLIGIFLIFTKTQENSLLSISFLLIGISIFISAFFYTKNDIHQD